MFRVLTETVTDKTKLDYVRKVARTLGGNVYSDVPYVKIKFYHLEKFPRDFLNLIQRLLPRDSFETYQARAPHWSVKRPLDGIPAVRIRRDSAPRIKSALDNPILTLITADKNEDCIAEAASIFPGKFDGRTPMYILRDAAADIYFMSPKPFSLEQARGFDK